jgi:hypothetical protein
MKIACFSVIILNLIDLIKGENSHIYIEISLILTIIPTLYFIFMFFLGFKCEKILHFLINTQFFIFYLV